MEKITFGRQPEPGEPLRWLQLTEAKGFHDLAELLANPDARIHSLELAVRTGTYCPDAPDRPIDWNL